MVRLILSLDISPMVVVMGTQIVVFLAGMFMDPVSIMMITIPLFVPAVTSLGLDPVWFGVITLINITVAGISPPFGLCLFVMKGVAPANTTMGQIYKASLPRIVLSLINMALIMAYPQLALWLPAQMR